MCGNGLSRCVVMKHITSEDVDNTQMALLRNHGSFARKVDAGRNEDPVIQVSDVRLAWAAVDRDHRRRLRTHLRKGTVGCRRPGDAAQAVTALLPGPDCFHNATPTRVCLTIVDEVSEESR